MKLTIAFCALLVAVTHAQQLHCTNSGIKTSLRCYDKEVPDEKPATEFCSDSPTYQLGVEGASIKTLNIALFADFKGNCHFHEFVMFNGQLEKIEQGAFEKFPKLATIFLNENKIKTVAKNTFKKIDGGDMPNIKRLSLDQNEIDTIEEGAFAGLTGLEDLDLSQNKLTEINLAHLPNNLHLLQLQNNDLEKLTGEPGTYSVYALDVSSTKIKPAQLSVLKADALERLYIDNNGFTAADLAPLANFKNLKSLNISANHLDGLQVSFFDNFPLLEMVDLSNTGLKNIDLTPIMANKPELMSFYFSNNEIDKFDFSKVPSNVSDISFHGNKFNFKCNELQTIIDNLAARNVSVREGWDSGENIQGIACSK